MLNSKEGIKGHTKAELDVKARLPSKEKGMMRWTYSASIEMAFKVSSLVRCRPAATARSCSSRRARSHRPCLCCAAVGSSRKMRARRKAKRRRERRRSAPEEERQVAAKGSLRAKGQRRETRSFQWLWPPPVRSFSLLSTTKWNAILRFAVAGPFPLRPSPFALRPP
ncbi:unnamed protein product [Musa banksii]